MEASQKLVCEMTVRDGKVVYDLNGMTAERRDTVSSEGERRW